MLILKERGFKMKKTAFFALSFTLVAVLAFGILTAEAGKPKTGGVFNGNGFPSGPHFNLNIKAKNPDTFTCPDQADVIKYYCPDSGVVYDNSPGCNDVCGSECIEVYGNVIFFPQGNGDENFSILMESGKEKPKGKPTEPVNYPDLLEVTDWCTGFESNDNAVVRIPADPDGYAVYARLTGDPKEDPAFEFADPRLDYVEDDGQDLMLLGFISNGVWNPSGDPIGSISRTKGQGVRKATNITPLFMWSGDICTFIDWGDGGELIPKCCIDTSEPADGIYDECIDPTDPESDPPCEEGYTIEETYCVNYEEPVWVFNIAEFVGMLFDIHPDGAYKASLIQIRFYPLPLNTKEN
jgi:hypothetical protein